MSLDRDERKTFPDEPGYNVGAALGLIAGMGAGLLATIDVIPLPGLASHSSDWATNVGLSAILGGILGAVMGAILDRSHR
jgi:lipoprotein signal peptidase